MSAAERLRGPGFQRLFALARARVEREPSALDTAKVRVSDAAVDERDAISGLLGRSFKGAHLTVALSELDAALVTGTGRGLIAWLTTLGGPLRDRPTEASEREAAIRAALDDLRSSPLAPEPWFQAWMHELRQGPLTRAYQANALGRVRSARRVLEALPAANLPIALFASDHAGGTKALDSTPLDTLVLGALALRAGCAPPTKAEARRALWERFGVLPDDLASQVLVLNLPAVGDGLVDQLLRLAAAEGAPLRLTLHQLTKHPPRLAPQDLYVCENPAVLRMAAERLGAASAPLIATEGYPSAAFWRLIERATGAVFVRADLDKEGLEIAAAVLSRTGGRPWRMDTSTYLAHRGQNALLPNALPETPWDPPLSTTMAGQVRVEEEELLDALLEDLGGPQ